MGRFGDISVPARFFSDSHRRLLTPLRGSRSNYDCIYTYNITQRGLYAILWVFLFAYDNVEARSALINKRNMYRLE